ncbi:MAG: hypothetical protein Q9227_009079 [Pyrenula ochraceoflavens]
MADKQKDTNEFLRRPLYLFDLPQELLLTLTQRNENPQRIIKDNISPTPESETPERQSTISASTSCALCQLTFPSVADQRDHAKSDLHRYNLKCRLRGTKTVDEATFNQLIGDLDESISGSESSDSSDEDRPGAKSGDTTLASLLKRQAKISQERQADSENSSPKGKRGPGKPPVLWLESPKLPEHTVLGVYTAILTLIEQEEADIHLVDIVKSKQLKPIPAKSSSNKPAETGGSSPPQVFLCMIGGGHFAAMIVSLIPSLVKGAGGHEERHARVLAHKTFHRYTTRRKQGGSQAANDSSKGAAHSAGSSLRRYNEAALEADVRNILKEWKQMIDDSQLLFIRATGSTNRRTLFGPYDGQVLRHNDPRVRGFPFSTRRATQGELMRSFSELTRLKVNAMSETSLEEKDQASTTAPAVKAPPKEPSKPTLSPEEEIAAHHTSQLNALIRRSKAPAVLTYLSKNSLPASYTFYPPESHYHAPTPLHLASSSNSPAVVSALLTKAGADPTLVNQSGRTPFEIAGNLATRDAFRVARGILESENTHQWDWARSRVPSALTQAQVEERLKREKASTDAAEGERRKAELERIQKEEEDAKVGKIERKAGSGKALGVAAEKTGAEKREEEGRGMTPEMRMRLERERRARAAEERLERMQALILILRPSKMQITPLFLLFATTATLTSAWTVPNDVPDKIYIDGRDARGHHILRTNGNAFDLSSDSRSVPIPEEPRGWLSWFNGRKADELRRALEFHA